MIRSLRDKCRTENVGVFRGEIAFSKAGFDMLNNKIQLKPENASVSEGKRRLMCEGQRQEM